MRRLQPVQWFLLAGLIALLAVPLSGEIFYVRLATRALIFGIIAMSLNLLVGYTGLVSFGHAIFVGLGAYATAILTYHGVLSSFIVWPAAVALAALAAFAIGAVALRTSGVYFIMITLAFGQMFYYIAVGLERYGGDDGLRMAARNSVAGPIDLADPSAFFYVVAILFVGVLYSTKRVVQSHFGRVLRGIKDNERRMQSVGFNTFHYKLIIFAIAGAIAGLGGALNANLNTHVSPGMLHWVLSGDLLVMVILGGVGTLAGPVLGAAGFILLEEALSTVTKHWMAVLGLVMLLIVIFHRGGLYALFAGRLGRAKHD